MQLDDKQAAQNVHLQPEPHTQQATGNPTNKPARMNKQESNASVTATHDDPSGQRR